MPPPSRYPMPGRALRLDPRYGTVLEPVTLLGYDPARRTFRVRYADGTTTTSHTDSVLRGVRGAPGADRRRAGHAAAPHRHTHGARR